MLVDTIVARRLPIYRVGCRRTARFRKAFTTADDQISVCWAYMTHAIQDLLADALVFPVMDMARPKARSTLSRFVTAMNALRGSGDRDRISVRHNRNLAEILFADSEFSVMTQLVDLVCWLRGVSDLHAAGETLGSLKTSMLPLARRLDTCMQFECTDRARFVEIDPSSTVHHRLRHGDDA